VAVLLEQADGAVTAAVHVDPPVIPDLALPLISLLPGADGHDSGSRTPVRRHLVEPLLTTGLPHDRAIVALDIESSTSRPDPIKAELRSRIYELFGGALCSAGIHKRHRDRFMDRGDDVLALIHPVDQAPKALLLNRAIPAVG